MTRTYQTKRKQPEFEISSSVTIDSDFKLETNYSIPKKNKKRINKSRT